VVWGCDESKPRILFPKCGTENNRSADCRHDILPTEIVATDAASGCTLPLFTCTALRTEIDRLFTTGAELPAHPFIEGASRSVSVNIAFAACQFHSCAPTCLPGDGRIPSDIFSVHAVALNGGNAHQTHLGREVWAGMNCGGCFSLEGLTFEEAALINKLPNLRKSARCSFYRRVDAQLRRNSCQNFKDQRPLFSIGYQ
jgi:hypothetical protein